MILRAATRMDYTAIRAAVGSWWGDRDLTPLLQSLFLENFSSTSLVLEDESGSMMGFLVGFPSVDDATAAYVHFLGVAPTARRQGIGRHLHEAFAEMMQQRGVTTIRCVTSPVNSQSVAFHESIGFDIESRDDHLVHFVRVVDATRRPRRPDPRPDDSPWPQAQWPVPESTVLAHGDVQLALASVDDAEELFSALDHDAVWTHVRGRPSSALEMAASLESARATGRWPWTVRRRGEVVGTTSYLEVSPVDARLEIGFTLYAPCVWASEVNPTCKLLLMDWAFSHGYGRVQLKTDIRNSRSQGAIERLGAQYEGILRRYQRRQDNSVRDTVLYSVIVEEWPGVRDRLLSRVQTLP